MTLRTPRRRISPRTKQKYRAIKQFLQRAIGASSQVDIKNDSYITDSICNTQNITTEKEQQWKVHKHCRDLACLENTGRREIEQDNKSECKQIVEGNDKKLTIRKSSTSLHRPSKDIHICKSQQYLQSHAADSNTLFDNNVKDNDNYMMQNTSYDECIKGYNLPVHKTKKKDRLQTINECKPRLFYDRNKPQYDNNSLLCSTSSHHSILDRRIHRKEIPEHDCHRDRKHKNKLPANALTLETRRETDHFKRNHPEHLQNTYTDHNRKSKNRHDQNDLDQQFIAHIIKKQYKPELLGRRQSDFSQFSAPVCRDHEFTIREHLKLGSELCSCCYDRPRSRYICSNDLSDLRSVCDTRLYSSKKYKKYKRHTERLENYNDSALYDVIPVKERSSPKTRRKFVEDNKLTHQHYREVPPSPRTHRPQLNLTAQLFDENTLPTNRVCRKRSVDCTRRTNRDVVESDISSAVFIHNKHRKGLEQSEVPLKPINIRDDFTANILQKTQFMNEQSILTNNDVTLNTQITDTSADKTDKTLSEIKEILQSFLQEIKKEPSQSQDHPSVNNHSKTSGLPPSSGNNLNSYSQFGPQCNINSFIPTFPNPCCYPIVPVYPMNCMQNGYIVPSPSCACTCANQTATEKELSSSNKYNIPQKTNCNDETQELIKEIYKFVSQSPQIKRKKDEDSKFREKGNKILTSRSAGKSSRTSKHDAKVGTPALKCYSKSCEAIGSRYYSDAYYKPNVSYSDTVLEKLSLDISATQSTSESVISSEDKVKRNKFKKALQSIGLFRKKKKDLIEELSESESSIEVDIKPKQKTPYRQKITNYAMHGQEYFQQPPSCNGYQCCPQSFDPRICCPQPPMEMYTCRHPHEYTPAPNGNSRPTAPPYPNYNHVQPQVPLCLKEIEVKSIGTQSQRKMSIFTKFNKKLQPPEIKEEPLKTKVQTAKPLFDWKSLQAKAMQNADPMKFSLKTQKELAEGNAKMKNALVKKLFYKRNPFSPRNLIIRTLLGKDKSSFGDPPKMYRPRMFI